jgi:phospholipid/cholesterol/gamma-HCH transport system substrate-binding protein
VPVTRTTEPVSLLDLFNIFNLPTRQRFSAIIDELGIGTAARGNDFNDILRRANPTLALARRVISILDRQRRQLGATIDATNTIAREGAAHPVAVQSFLERAAALTTVTASHHDALSQSIARLPGLLAAAQPSLQQLDTVAREGTPLVAQLHAAVPSLTRVQNDLGPFVAAARPALSALAVSLRKATPALRATTPLVKTIRSYTQRSLPGTQLFARLASNLQQHGFVENFLGVFYYVAASLARFDTDSHMLSILLVGAQNGLCGNYATTPVAGCSAHYGAQTAYRPAAATSKRSTSTPPATTRTQGRRPTKAPARPGPAPAPTPSAPSPTGPTQPTPPTGPVQQTVNTLGNLVNFLLK